MKNGRQQSETKGRKTELKDGRGAIVLQLHRAIKGTRENGKQSEKWGGKHWNKGSDEKSRGL